MVSWNLVRLRSSHTCQSSIVGQYGFFISIQTHTHTFVCYYYIMLFYSSQKKNYKEIKNFKKVYYESFDRHQKQIFLPRNSTGAIDVPNALTVLPGIDTGQRIQSISPVSLLVVGAFIRIESLGDFD